MFLRYTKLAHTPCLSEGFGLGHTVSNWATGRGSLSRKLFNGTVCGHTCSEVSSLRAKQAVTLNCCRPDLLHSFQLTAHVSVQVTVALALTGMGIHVASTKTGLSFPRCPKLFFLLWKSSSSDLLQFVQYLMVDLRHILRRKFISFFTSLLCGQGTDVGGG